MPAPPPPSGLYDPRFEREACALIVSAVADGREAARSVDAHLSCATALPSRDALALPGTPAAGAA